MTDDFDITMACLTAIEQEVRRAKLALLQAWGHATPHVGGRVNAEDCPRCAVDPPNYPFICPGDAPATPAQDAHTPREQPQTRSGGTESGEVGLSGTCARCGAPITLPMSDPENREMAVCTPCEIGLLREGYQQARAQVERVRTLADAWDAMADAMMSRDDAELVTASAKSVRDALDGASSKAGGNGEVGA